MQDIEQAIRESAYHLWVADGCPDGNAERYWLAAQRAVVAASLKDIGRVKVSPAGAAGKKVTTSKDAKAVKAKSKRRVA